MPMFKGTAYSKDITIKQSDGSAQDVTGWELWSQIRDDVNGEVLHELTILNGGWSILDGAAGQVRMLIDLDFDDVEGWPDGIVVGDVLRMDSDPGPSYLFGFRFKVKTPVTRDG